MRESRAAAPFAVLAAATVTNTGPSTITGNLGVSPGTAVTGFPPGRVVNGTVHSADSAAAAAKISLATAYTDIAGRKPTAIVGTELGGKTFGPGVYSHTTLGITGTVTLNANGDPNAVFIFQSASTLITASSSVVKLTNGAKASNVCWQVGSSATLGTNSHFVGTIMALCHNHRHHRHLGDGPAAGRNGCSHPSSNNVTLPDSAVTS